MTHPTFITLGPEGTCHENALLHYLEFQGLTDFEVDLVDDLLKAIGRVREQPNTFLVQCSAHVQVHLVTERYHEEVFVIDTFIYPTKELGLVVRTDVEEPKSLGIVSATRGYLDLSPWEAIIDEPSKPVVARHLLEGRYDAGLTHVHHAAEHPEDLRLVEYYGAVDTTWVVYGARKRFQGTVIGQRVPWLFRNAGRSVLREIAGGHPRWGWTTAHQILLREGWALNRKRTRRIWRQEGLRRPVKARKRRPSTRRAEATPQSHESE